MMASKYVWIVIHFSEDGEEVDTYCDGEVYTTWQECMILGDMYIQDRWGYSQCPYRNCQLEIIKRHVA
jgi:hypothetical protein